MNLSLGLFLCIIISSIATNNDGIEPSLHMLDSFEVLRKGIDWNDLKQISKAGWTSDPNNAKVVENFSHYLAQAVNVYERALSTIIAMCQLWSNFIDLKGLQYSTQISLVDSDNILKRQHSNFIEIRTDLEVITRLLQQAGAELEKLDLEPHTLSTDTITAKITLKKCISGEIQIEIDGFERPSEINTLLRKLASETYISNESKYMMNDGATLIPSSSDKLQHYREILPRLREARGKIGDTIMSINRNLGAVSQAINMESAKLNSFSNKCNVLTKEFLELFYLNKI